MYKVKKKDNEFNYSYRAKGGIMIFDLYDISGNRITYVQMSFDFSKGDNFRIGNCLFEWDIKNKRYFTCDDPIKMIEGYKKEKKFSDSVTPSHLE